MSAFNFIRDSVIPMTWHLLPARMQSPEAEGMLLAIGLQESRFDYRAQIRGPARGFWQFEQGGGWKGVISHPSTRGFAQMLFDQLAYPKPEFDSLTHNDVLACAFARLLLWTDAHPLPKVSQRDEGWQYYLRTWRPGKPHPETWAACWMKANQAR